MAKNAPYVRVAPGDKWSQYIGDHVITRTISKVDYDPKKKVWMISFEDEEPILAAFKEGASDS